LAVGIVGFMLGIRNDVALTVRIVGGVVVMPYAAAPNQHRLGPMTWLRQFPGLSLSLDPPSRFRGLAGQSG